jgi:hypothetical protein
MEIPSEKSRPIQLRDFTWINPPQSYSLEKDVLHLQTDPETDFWQRTYYGFRNDNAHGFLLAVEDLSFSFSVMTKWSPRARFDQCGILLYQDAENWIKASAEYETSEFARLGSVVTNLGYSDWATTDIDADTHQMYYRLSRRGQDFLLENSIDGEDYHQMRICHIHMPLEAVRVGVYACSPMASSMPVKFSDFCLGLCQWQEHEV